MRALLLEAAGLGGLRMSERPDPVPGAGEAVVALRAAALNHLDIWVRPTPENARRVHRALVAFGAPLAGISPQDFATPGLVYQIGIEPVRIDILTSLTGVEFEAAYSRRRMARYGGVPASFLGRADLIANKTATGRPQDLVDVELLNRMSDPPQD